MENVNTQLMTADQQAEYDKYLAAGSSFVGAKRGGFYVPTIKINNSDTTFKKTGVALGNFFLREVKNREEFITDLGANICGVILKVSYSIKSIYDPNKLVNYYSREFDNFFEDTITVYDATAKKGEEGYVMFEGEYKQWKEENQIIKKSGNKNDFELNVHLYILVDGDVDEPKVQRLTFKGRSMSEWFSYVNGNKEKGIESIYTQGIQPHSAIHNFSSADDLTPKKEKYWYISFSVDTKLNLESLKKVVDIQRELDKQIREMRYGAIKKREAEQPKTLGKVPDNSAIRDDEVVGGGGGDSEDEIKLSDVPF